MKSLLALAAVAAIVIAGSLLPADEFDGQMSDEQIAQEANEMRDRLEKDGWVFDKNTQTLICSKGADENCISN